MAISTSRTEATGAARGGVQLIHSLFEAQVDRTPDATAVTQGPRRLTFRELDARANEVAHLLRSRGIGPEHRVAVCLDRSPEMAIAVLGTLKAGAAYVPIDPGYPEDRVALMLDDADCALVLTEQRLSHTFKARSIEHVIIEVDDATTGTSERVPMLSDPDDLAYMIYTSGSTGRPKAVAVPHRGVVNQNLAIADYFGLSAADRVAHCTSLSFDISVEELFPSWSRGATVVMYPPGVVGAGAEFSRWVADERVSVLDLPTAFWHAWVSHLSRSNARVPDSLRLVVVGGQQASAQTLAAWRARSESRVTFINGYGPTEASIASIFFTLDGSSSAIAADADVPIGVPIANTSAYILNSQLEPCTAGSTGELYVGGVGVARGYLHQPALTASRFLPDPFSAIPGARMYRTGDLAHRRADGLIEFRGRSDSQVKIRGFRIELSEIESALRRHPSVVDAAVVVEAGSDDGEIAGYVVGAKDQSVMPSDLRRFLQRTLPGFMVPARIMVLDSLPLTAGGKLDKSRLPAPPRTRDTASAPFTLPAGEVQTAVVRVWSEVLGIQEIGADDNFLEIGGHSLRAAQVVARLRDVFDVDVPIAAMFAHPTIARLSSFIESIRRHATATEPGTIERAARDAPIPLSCSQERAWFQQRLSPGSLAYHFQTTLHFTGALDAATLRAALTEIVRRHEILRTTFPETADGPVQRIHDPFEVELPHVDLRTLPEAARPLEFRRIVEAAVRTPFDMSRLPLIRWLLIQTGDRDWSVVHVEHHLIHDGWSFNVFRRELLQLYLSFSRGEASPLEPLPIQFADFAVRQRRWLAGPEVAVQSRYWSDQLRETPVLELPSSRPRPPVQTYDGSIHEMELAPDLAEAIRALSRREGVTLFMTLLTAFIALLHRYTGQADLSVGSAVANRRWHETESLIGMFVNNIVIRSRLAANPSFRSLLQDVRQATIDAYLHQDIPFDHVVKAVGPPRDPSRNPLFQVMFSFHDSPLEEPVVPGLDFSCAEIVSNGSAKFDLNVIAVPHAEQRAPGSGELPGGITMVWEYNTALYDGDQVERMSAHFRQLVEAMTRDAGALIHEADLLTAEEHRQLAVWNDTAAKYPRDETIHTAFAKHAAQAPDRIALVFGREELTYGVLESRANQLARFLQANGVALGDLVGISLDRTPDLVISILGILKAGAAYVPIDSSYPDERIAFMLRDSGVRLVLTTQAFASKVPPDGCRAIAIDAERDRIAAYPATGLEVGAVAADLAYVIYTSGSTGRPKGVEIPHLGVLRLVYGSRFATLDADRRILHRSSITFDLSTLELWGALLHGACVVLMPGAVPTADELGATLRDHAVTTVWLTASHFNTVLDEQPEALRTVRELLIGGEALSVPHIRRGVGLLPATRLINGYGPTESTTFACCYPIGPTLDGIGDSIPIGGPIANTRTHVLDASLMPVPVGVTGEIYIAGDGLARGYLRQPGLTASRFIPDPFGPPGSRMYRSGDLGRWRSDGAIEFLGRTDRQVKVHGFRIELEEIEHAIRDYPDVREAAVVLREDLPGGKGVVAYVVLAEAAAGVSGLRAYLAERMPAFMVPSQFVALPALPMNSSGKVDRRALPAPQRALAAERTVAAPANDLEAMIAGIWADLLRIPAVSTRDNFFDLGGDSLLAVRLVARIHAELQVDIPLQQLFDNATVEGLAGCVFAEASRAGVRRSGGRRFLFELKQGEGTPIYFVPGGRGGDYEFLVYARLLHFVAGGFRFFGLRAQSAEGREHAQSSVEQMASDYLREIREVQPAGPYYLVGNCIGGVVAYELARQIEATGQTVGMLVLMDTEFPTVRRLARHVGERLRDAAFSRLPIEYYLDRFQYHRQAMHSLNVSGRLQYVLGPLGSLLGPAPKRAGDAPAMRLRDTYVDTLRRYHPGPYGGPLGLILSEEFSGEAARQWARVATGPTEVLPTPGDHESYIRDHVRDAAGRLRECLSRVRQAPK